MCMCVFCSGSSAAASTARGEHDDGMNTHSVMVVLCFFTGRQHSLLCRCPVLAVA